MKFLRHLLNMIVSVAKLTEELKIAIIQTIRTLVKNAEHRYVLMKTY